MKRFFMTLMMFVVLAGSMCVPANAAVIGEVITTDIVAFIDEQPIASYNINDYTYVIAEDLREYGFDVRWDAAARRLDIHNRQDNRMQCYPSAELINVRKDEIKRGVRAFDVYETDIVTYLDNEPVNAYNVDGQTLIQIDALSRWGYFSYNDDRREVKINLAAFYTDWLYSLSTKETLMLPCDKEEGKITYSGTVQNGVPSGFGRITEEYEYTNGLQSTETYVTTTKFVDGAPYGVLYHYGKKIPHNGSDTRVREYYKFENYLDGKLSGMAYSLELIDDGTVYRTEGTYREGEQIFRRVTEPDASYRYGYKVVEEGYLDSLGNMIDYDRTEAGKIVSVHAGFSGGYAIDENGTLFGIGSTVKGERPVPVKLDENIYAAAGGGSGSDAVIDKNGTLYYLKDKIITYKNENVPVAAGNVKSVSDWFYLTSDGNLYIRPVDYNWTWYDAPTLLDTDVCEFSADGKLILYQKTDGSVYYARINSADSSWYDGYDLSKPVKVFDSALAISRGNRFLVVDENHTLVGWSSYWYGTKYEGDENDIFSTQAPIKLAEDVSFADSGSGFIAYVKTDGSLWVMPDFTEPENEMIFGITEPVKLADNVKTMSCGGGYLLFATEDGKLFSWGKNADGRLGHGGTYDAQEPYWIMDFYEFN